MCSALIDQDVLSFKPCITSMPFYYCMLLNCGLSKKQIFLKTFKKNSVSSKKFQKFSIIYLSIYFKSRKRKSNSINISLGMSLGLSRSKESIFYASCTVIFLPLRGYLSNNTTLQEELLIVYSHSFSVTGRRWKPSPNLT